MSDAKKRFGSVTVGLANFRLITMFCTKGMYYEVAKWEGEWLIIWSKTLPITGHPTNREEHQKIIQEQETVAAELLRSDLKESL